MRIFALTDIGKTREMNQDNFYISENTDAPSLFILADGMGGYAGGEIASSIAVEASKEYVRNKWQISNKTEKDILTFLKDATIYANEKIYEESKKAKELEEMGTTLDICLIYNEMLYISHIGDSRIYIINEDNIEQITTDHTYVEKLLEDGTITKEEAHNHPDRHMLMKALGSKNIVEPDVFSTKWESNAIICMCSDGLTNMINDEEIKEIVLNDIICPQKTLIKRANDMGGIDNITVILIKH